MNYIYLVAAILAGGALAFAWGWREARVHAVGTSSRHRISHATLCAMIGGIVGAVVAALVLLFAMPWQ